MSLARTSWRCRVPARAGACLAASPYDGRDGARVKKQREHNLTIRISQADRDTLVERAEEAGMTQSEYLRFLIRRARIRVSVEIDKEV